MMKFTCLVSALILVMTVAGCQPGGESGTMTVSGQETDQAVNNTVSLPEQRLDGEVSLEQSLSERRSTRSYSGESLTLAEVSQLLWAAQGVTDASGHRTAPSAGAIYPLELYLVAGNVENLEPGLYHYLPGKHQLVLVADGDVRTDLASAALSQSSVRNGAVSIVITAVYERTTARYGERGIRYVHIEVGHAAQNICLQAAALGLGLVTVGAFDDEQVSEILDLPADENPLYIIPVGRKL